jgi:hypothetical protein
MEQDYVLYAPFSHNSSLERPLLSDINSVMKESPYAQNVFSIESNVNFGSLQHQVSRCHQNPAYHTHLNHFFKIEVKPRHLLQYLQDHVQVISSLQVTLTQRILSFFIISPLRPTAP